MLFITGFHASGKTVASEFLSREYPILYVETSSIVKGAHQLSSPYTSIGEWARQMEHDYGPSVFDDLIADYAIVSLSEARERGEAYCDVLISGNRNFSGIEHISERLSDYPELVLMQREILFVDVPLDIQYERFRERGREAGDKDMSYEQFLSHVIGAEIESGLHEIVAHATREIVNDNDLACFHDELRRVVRELGIDKKEFEGERIPRV